MSEKLNLAQRQTLRDILDEVNSNGGWIWWQKSTGRTRTINSLIKRGLLQERTAPNGGSQLNVTALGMAALSDAGRAALAEPPAPEPPACPNCDAGRVMRLDNGNLYCPFCGWQTLNANPPSPALVNDGGPEYAVAEAWRGYAIAAEERADNAEWAVGELRAALSGMLEEPEIEHQHCPRCGASYSAHPVRHAAGCPVGRAEDALRDTAEQSKPRELARYEALVRAAEGRNAEFERRLSLAESKIGALLEAAWVIVDPSGNAPDAKTALRAALAALEGDSHE